MAPGERADEAWEARAAGGAEGRLDLDTTSGSFELAGNPRAAEALLAELRRRRPGRSETVVPAGSPLEAPLRASGFGLEREVWQLRKDVRPPQPQARWPEGVAVRTYRDEDAAAVHALLERAFADSHESVLPFEPWLAWMTGDASFEPRSWWLAERDSGLVGVALCWREGWLKDLAVAPELRRHGLGGALLRHVFAAFHERGANEVGLKVDADNPTGAVRLYERAGMVVVQVHRLFAR